MAASSPMISTVWLLGRFWKSVGNPADQSTRSLSRVAVLAGLVTLALLHVGFWLYLDYGPARLRDPEFARRLAAAQQRTAENPQAKLVLVLGSSRVAMGVRPAELYSGTNSTQIRGPLLLNFSLAGSGPIMELMALRRALNAGLKPDAVLMEFWPAFLREDGPYHEDARLDPTRLNQHDGWMVDKYFRPEHKANVAAQWKARKLQPWYAHRKSLMNQLAAPWLPYNQRSEAIWDRIDAWGWLPGRERATPEQAKAALEAAGNYYRPLFDQYEVSSVAKQAFAELIAECRANDIPLSLLYLPESEGFLQLMPPSARLEAEDYLKKLQTEERLPLIDTRGWVADDQLPDGFHLTQPGASELTRKLLPAVEATLPQLRDDTR